MEKTKRRLTGKQQSVLIAWLAEHPHPIALLRFKSPRMYRAARQIGLEDEEITAELLLAATYAAAKYEEGRASFSTLMGIVFPHRISEVIDRHFRRCRQAPAGSFSRDAQHRRLMNDVYVSDQGDGYAVVEAEEFVASVLPRAGLRPREVQALRRYYGLGVPPGEFADIAVELSFSSTRAAQVVRSAEKKIRAFTFAFDPEDNA